MCGVGALSRNPMLFYHMDTATNTETNMATNKKKYDNNHVYCHTHDVIIILFVVVFVAIFVVLQAKPRWQASSFFLCLALSHILSLWITQSASTHRCLQVTWRKQYGGHHECDRHTFQILIILDMWLMNMATPQGVTTVQPLILGVGLTAVKNLKLTNCSPTTDSGREREWQQSRIWIFSTAVQLPIC